MSTVGNIRYPHACLTRSQHALAWNCGMSHVSRGPVTRPTGTRGAASEAMSKSAA